MKTVVHITQGLPNITSSEQLGFPKVWDNQISSTLRNFLLDSGYSREETDLIYGNDLYRLEFIED